MTRGVFISGGAGAVGSAIGRRLLQQGRQVVVVDILNDETSTPEEKRHAVSDLRSIAAAHGAGFDFYPGDIGDTSLVSSILNRHAPSVVIHAAALVRDRASVLHPRAFVDCNVGGTASLLEAIGQSKYTAQLILISSRSAVGEVSQAGCLMSETDALCPINPYGATKAAAEHLCHSFHANSGVPTTVLRLNPQICSRADMMPRRILEALQSGNEIVKFGSGESSRDWMSPEDTADAVLCAMAKPAGYQLYLLGTGRATTLNRLISAAETVVGKKVRTRYEPHPPGDAIHGGIADASLVRDALGWQPVRSLEQALEDLFDNLKRHRLSLP